MKDIFLTLFALGIVGAVKLLFGREDTGTEEAADPDVVDDDDWEPEADDAEDSGDDHLMDADADADACSALPEEIVCEAEITESCREMNPVTLQGGSRIVCRCEDGEERKFFLEGGNGMFLLPGDRGFLTYRDAIFVSFEKENGEIVGAMYHIVPEEEEARF